MSKKLTDLQSKIDNTALKVAPKNEEEEDEGVSNDEIRETFVEWLESRFERDINKAIDEMTANEARVMGFEGSPEKFEQFFKATLVKMFDRVAQEDQEYIADGVIYGK